jgi:hypothetical protein
MIARPRIVDTWVRGEPRPSDHAPVWVELSEGTANVGNPSAKRPRLT